MPIKDFIHHHPRAHFYHIAGRDALLRHTKVWTQFYGILGSGEGDRESREREERERGRENEGHERYRTEKESGERE